MKKVKFKSDFSKNVFTLMTGSLIAQAIPIIISPILTRIYTPEEFGIFATYIAFISIGTALVTAKYESAILLPKEENKAKYLVLISILSSLIFSFIIFIGILIFYTEISLTFSFGNLSLYYIPFGIFLFAIYAIFIQWANRKKEYHNMNKNRLIQSSSISFFQIIISYLVKTTSGLVLADVLGRLIAILFILKRTIHQVKLEKVSIKKIFFLIKKYKKFPKYEMPAAVFNITSFELPYIIIPIYFISSVAGFYFLVFRVLMIPISFLGSAVTEVFKNRAIEDINKYSNCTKIYKKIFLLLFSLGLIPLLVILVYGQEIFAFIFGENWKEAGLYAQILAPLALLRLISSPLSYLFIIREKLELDLLLQFVFFLLVLSSLFVSSYFNNSILLISLLSISGCIFYLIQIILSYRLSYED